MSTSMKDLLEAGVHFGHQTQRWNPKMDKYIYGAKSGIHILDLRITYEAISSIDLIASSFPGIKKSIPSGFTFKSIGGIVNLNKLPDALFVVDLANETTAITEAQKLGIPVIGLADSNVNPEGIDFLIPGNDDAIRSIELIASAIADACLKGSGKRDQVENKESE